MVKTFSVFLISLFTLVNLVAQQGEAVVVLNQIYCLGIRSCMPYASAEVDLPANTVKWFYTVTATRKRRVARRIKKNPTLLGTFPNIKPEGIDQPQETSEDFTPVFIGDGICSVYLLKSASDGDNFITTGGVFNFYSDFSEKNVPSLGMVIDEPKLCRGTQRIGLKNPIALLEPGNMYVVLTIVAITNIK